MIIQPGTTIKILHNVPLDNSYDHTIFFSTQEAQVSYFSGLSKYTVSESTYQRVNLGLIRVGLSADNLYDCNYLMFQNTSFGNKWFYAFITSVEYVNNACSLIRYEMDVLQTWHFDYSPDICFVERCHTPTDLIGEHIEPEPFDLGEMVFNTYTDIPGYSNLSVIMAIVDTDSAVEGGYYDGIFGGAELWGFNSDDTAGIVAKLEEYIQKPEAVVSMYMCPSILIRTTIPDGGTRIHHTLSGTTTTVTSSTLGTVTATTRLDGYLPHNCKMYTYPYNYLHVDNASGGSLSLRYEFFLNGAPTLTIAGGITQPVSMVCYPSLYKGVSGVDSGGRTKTLNTESLQINNYPMCSWTTDAYTAWIAQNALPIAYNAVGAAASLALSGRVNTSSVPFIANSVIQQVLSVMSQGYQASIAADVMRGNLNNGGANCTVHKQTFWYGRCSVNQYTAKIIDGAFDMYGYSVRSKQPVMRNARPEWTYVKTIGACISGSVPADDMKKIIEIYDSGCTWWINGAHLGQYNLSNLATERG